MFPSPLRLEGQNVDSEVMSLETEGTQQTDMIECLWRDGRDRHRKGRQTAVRSHQR